MAKGKKKNNQSTRWFKITYTTGVSRGFKAASEYGTFKDLHAARVHARDMENKLELQLSTILEEKHDPKIKPKEG